MSVGCEGTSKQDRWWDEMIPEVNTYGNPADMFLLKLF